MKAKTVIAKDYHRFDPVGQKDVCADCPSACKTSCARKLAQDIHNKGYVFYDDAGNRIEDQDRID
ncbi:MAG: hypothetical protein RSA49_01810 [Anaerovoracaceae bacterium]